MNGHKLNREDGQVVSRASLKLGEILLNEKLITQSDLENALDQQSKKGGRLGEILVKQGVMQMADMLAALSLQSNVPVVDLKDVRIEGSVLQLVPEEIARKATLIPLEIQADVLTVAMAFPDDVRTLRDIATRSERKSRRCWPVLRILWMPSTCITGAVKKSKIA